MTQLDTTSAIAAPTRASAPSAVTAADVAAAGSRWPLVLAVSMLFLGALPDGLVAPLLDDLFVQRYGAGVAASHWFMAVNLIGALAAIPALLRLRRMMPPSLLLAAAAVCNGLLLGVMALPIGFAATLGLRIVEGGADLIMLAVIFDLLGKAGRSDRCGARFGIAGTVLLLGIAGGVGAGGMLGQSEPVLAFVMGAVACLVVAGVAIIAHAPFDGLVRQCPVVTDAGAIRTRRSRLWPTLAMATGDRAIAGLTTTTVMFYFAHVAQFEPSVRGMLLGLSLLALALGAWPAGILGDRIGHLRLRTGASLVYGGCLALIPLATGSGVAAALLVMVGFGLSGSVLMPTTVALANGSGRGAMAMAGYHACGNFGYHLLGVGGAATLIALFSTGPTPGPAAYHAIMFMFAGGYVVVSLVAALALRRNGPISASAA